MFQKLFQLYHVYCDNNNTNEYQQHKWSAIAKAVHIESRLHKSSVLSCLSCLWCSASVLHLSLVWHLRLSPTVLSCLWRQTSVLRLSSVRHVHLSSVYLKRQIKINFKVMLLTFKTLQSGQPSYLNSLLAKATPSRILRSNQGPLLTIPRLKTVTGSRAWSSCAPLLWNSLPLSLRSVDSTAPFRKHLKTHLFGLAYPP